MRTGLTRPPEISGTEVFQDAASVAASFNGCSVVCIGTFDGVHRGHQAILARGKAISLEQNLHLVVVTFHPHPKSVVAPQHSPMLLTEPEEKAALLKAGGAETLLQLRFDHELAATSASDFLQAILVHHLRVAALVFGDDFRFGRGREGTPDFLRQWGQSTGCQIEVVKAVMGNELKFRISSSLVRDLLLRGEFEIAVALLGHAYPVSGSLVTGAGRGRVIGYPTWNLRPSEVKLAPPVGIYAGWAGRAAPRPAMVYYGSNPTFGADQMRVEAHLLDAGQDTTPEPKETIWLSAYIRAEVKYENADALVSQLADDERVVRNMLSLKSTSHPKV